MSYVVSLMSYILTSLVAASAIAASLSAGRPLSAKEATDRTIHTSPRGTDYVACKAKTGTKHLLARA